MYNPSDFMIDDGTLAEIRRESARAIQKHGHHDTPLNPKMPRGDKLAVLMEEVGEVAKVLCEFNLGNISGVEMVSQLRKELVQVAAVSAMWLETEMENGG